MNNLGVALLSQGKLTEVRLYLSLRRTILSAALTLLWCYMVLQGIEVLEGALNESPFEIVTTEPFLFNICESSSRATCPQSILRFFLRFLLFRRG